MFRPSCRPLVLASALLAGSAFAPVISAAGAGASAETSLADPSTWRDTGTIRRDVLQMALGAAGCAIRAHQIAAPTTLTVIDYSQPSSRKRLWVFDLRSHALLFQEYVAHGQGSGDSQATRFSNEPETHRSSLGLFRTDGTYVGKNGYSLRLDGLEAGFNDRARERAIVIHGAAYVSATVAKARGRVGRSWGCPALDLSIARRVIDEVKGSGLVFAYYPDPQWLNGSRFLGGCAAANGVPATGVSAAG